MSIEENRVTKTFAYRQEEAQNPFMGFTSFQHFRGDPLYTDIIVKPENNSTETEGSECYPVPPQETHRGREQGFYPDTTISYIRFLWKEFEPVQGQYNYFFIEDILNKARAKDQTVMFRMMPHSTRETDDVPDWLKTIIPCPARLSGVREKSSPTDPKFLELFGLAVRKIGERFDKDPVLEYMDISLPGAWGEGSHRGDYDEADLKRLVDNYTIYFPNTQLIGQSCSPEMLAYANETRDVAWRADGVGNPLHMNELYPARFEVIPSDLWEKAPVTIESYWWLCEWKRKGWDVDKIIASTLDWHISSVNVKNFPIPYEWEDKIKGWINKMGYHIMPVSVSYPEAIGAGETIIMDLCMENCGVAPIYHNIPFCIRLFGRGDSYVFPTDIRIKEWLPGKHEHRVEVVLPQEIPAGEYHLEIGIYNEKSPLIYFCTDAERNGNFYRIGKLSVESINDQ